MGSDCPADMGYTQPVGGRSPRGTVGDGGRAYRRRQRGAAVEDVDCTTSQTPGHPRRHPASTRKGDSTRYATRPLAARWWRDSPHAVMIACLIPGGADPYTASAGGLLLPSPGVLDHLRPASDLGLAIAWNWSGVMGSDPCRGGQTFADLRRARMRLISRLIVSMTGRGVLIGACTPYQETTS